MPRGMKSPSRFAAHSSRPGTSCWRNEAFAPSAASVTSREDREPGRGCAGGRAPSTRSRARRRPCRAASASASGRPARCGPRRGPCPTRSKRTVVRTSGSGLPVTSIAVIRNSVVCRELEVLHEGQELVAERGAVQGELRGQRAGAEDLELRAVAEGDLVGGRQAAAAELRGQERGGATSRTRPSRRSAAQLARGGRRAPRPPSPRGTRRCRRPCTSAPTRATAGRGAWGGSGRPSGRRAPVPAPRPGPRRPVRRRGRDEERPTRPLAEAAGPRRGLAAGGSCTGSMGFVPTLAHLRSPTNRPGRGPVARRRAERAVAEERRGAGSPAPRSRTATILRCGSSVDELQHQLDDSRRREWCR